ncbi:MAG: cytochrome-c oxidase, cbb3-type subunit II, partial [Mesorhizobium sp.]
MGLIDKHSLIEKNATLLLVGSLLVVTVGGIVEIAPLFYLDNTIEKV